MLAILLLYFFSSLVVFVLPRWAKNFKGILLSLVQFGAFALLLYQFSYIQQFGSYTTTYKWIQELGLTLSFTFDGLSILFGLLITGIGGLVFLYAHAYMSHYEGTDKFFFYLTVFSASMLGLVFSSNMVLLFVFWELTSILSFLLISFFHEKDTARKAAFQSLFITGAGGLSLLADIVLIGSITGSYEISQWIDKANLVRESNLYLPALLLILLGVFTKSAQFPFHFWLPGAMQAPTPVSSYLHSATMVKAGVFLLARLNPVLGGTVEWTHIIPLIGVITMLVGSYFAIAQTDLKAILAYTTISALGVLVLLFGIDTKESFKAALVFLYVHAFYKASLFMLAGYIDKKSGTRDINLLSGLAKPMPITFIVSFFALLSMAGLPPMLGFIGKELIYEAKVQSPGIASLVLILGVLSNVLMVAVSAFIIFRIFIGKKVQSPKPLVEKGVLYLVGPVVLVTLSLILGVNPEILGNLIESALGVVHNEQTMVKLSLWHGFNEVFFLSLFTVLSGVFLWGVIRFNPQFLNGWRGVNNKLFVFRFTDVFTSGVENFIVFSKVVTQRLQHGYHRYYLLTTLLFFTALLGYQLFLTWGWEIQTDFSFDPILILGLVIVMVLSVLFTITTRSRIIAIIAMGVVGYGISLIYMYYSAIDLAITQVLVETLTVVMFVLILQRLPKFARLSTRKTKVRDLAVSIAFGSVMSLVALMAINVNLQRPISEYFMQNSYLKAHGENVVNVILVDFRALDTLGEVTVLAVAALGVFALLNLKSKKL